MSFTDEDKDWLAALIRASEDRTGVLIRASEEKAIALDQTSEQRTAALVEKVETSLLTAFHQWAAPMDMRMKSHALAIRALDLETEALNERVTKLEPPH